MFYLFTQNNPGGVFMVNDKLCHRLFIEANSKEEAIYVAESLGCYWDGVSRGLDCPCCGNRWSKYCEEVNLEKFREDGYIVSIGDGIYHNTVAEWNKRYGSYKKVTKPHFETRKYMSGRAYVGSIKFDDIPEYAQFLANEYGNTTPDARIFYKNGDIEEISRS